MKLLTWISQILLIAMFAAGVSVITTWAIVDTYAERILEQFQLQDLYSAVGPEQVWGQVFGSTHTMVDDTDDAGAGANGTNEQEEGAALEEGVRTNEGGGDEQEADRTGVQDGSRAVEEPNGRTVIEEGVHDEQDVSEEAPIDALPVWGQGQAGGQQEGLDALVLTSEEFIRIRDEMSDDDKMQIFTLLASRIPQEELLQFSTWIENGLTFAELGAIESVVSQYLSEEEQNDLYAILAKY